ncbi:MAG: VIT domain-containing protein, partial [Phycisphaerales bacterium JB064]
MRHARRLSGRILGLSIAVAMAGVVALPTSARAQDDSLQPGINIVVPQRRVWQEGQRRAAIEIRNVEVVASAKEQAASTTIRLTLFNHGRQMAEAQVLLPVPEGAAIGAFRLEGLGEDGIAKIMPADEARTIYNRIVSSMRDPALLEFVGTSLVRSSVFPVPAQGEQVVSLTYDHAL